MPSFQLRLFYILGKQRGRDARAPWDCGGKSLFGGLSVRAYCCSNWQPSNLPQVSLAITHFINTHSREYAHITTVQHITAIIPVSSHYLPAYFPLPVSPTVHPTVHPVALARLVAPPSLSQFDYIRILLRYPTLLLDLSNEPGYHPSPRPWMFFGAVHWWIVCKAERPIPVEAWVCCAEWTGDLGARVCCVWMFKRRSSLNQA